MTKPETEKLSRLFSEWEQRVSDGELCARELWDQVRPHLRAAIRAQGGGDRDAQFWRAIDEAKDPPDFLARAIAILQRPNMAMVDNTAMLSATPAPAPDAPVFANDGTTEAQFIADDEISCPHCGGSGHRDDIAGGGK